MQRYRIWGIEVSVAMKISFERFGKNDVLRFKKHNYGWLKMLVLIIVLLIATFLLSLLVECKLSANVLKGQEATLESSIASYWGGIIGGIISGTFAFLGVFFTIKYYKDSDDHKEKLSVLPFLNVKIDNYKKDNDKNKGFYVGVYPDDKKKLGFFITIKNIGNGFANTLAIYTSRNDVGGQYFNEVIPIGEESHTYFIVSEEEMKDEIEFYISFVDAMTNEYIQKYTLKYDLDIPKIECGYPQNFV